jgi:hypothetical protein
MIAAEETTRRKRFYLEHIEKHLTANGLTRHEADRVLRVGWIKTKEFAHLLSRRPRSPNYIDRWIEFATRPGNTVGVIEQAGRAGRPQAPSDQQRTITFRMPESIRDRLRTALRERGWVEVVGKPGGHLDKVDQPMLRLLRDAERGRR